MTELELYDKEFQTKLDTCSEWIGLATLDTELSDDPEDIAERWFGFAEITLFNKHVEKFVVCTDEDGGVSFMAGEQYYIPVNSANIFALAYRSARENDK